jgi:hypothetical protein
LKPGKPKYPGADDHKKKNIIERLFKCFHHQKPRGLDLSGDIPSDQSLTHLLEISTSTTGPGS